MNKVKILKNCKGSNDGKSIERFSEGQEALISDSLLQCFIAMGVCELLDAEVGVEVETEDVQVDAESEAEAEEDEHDKVDADDADDAEVSENSENQPEENKALETAPESKPAKKKGK